MLFNTLLLTTNCTKFSARLWGVGRQAGRRQDEWIGKEVGETEERRQTECGQDGGESNRGDGQSQRETEGWRVCIPGKDRKRVGMTKNGKLKFTGHFPDVQFCAKTVTTYWQCSPQSHFTNKEPEAQKWNSLEPGWISKSDLSCINTQVPQPNLALSHGIYTKGNLAKFNEILKRAS